MNLKDIESGLVIEVERFVGDMDAHETLTFKVNDLDRAKNELNLIEFAKKNITQGSEEFIHEAPEALKKELHSLLLKASISYASENYDYWLDEMMLEPYLLDEIVHTDSFVECYEYSVIDDFRLLLVQIQVKEIEI